MYDLTVATDYSNLYDVTSYLFVYLQIVSQTLPYVHTESYSAIVALAAASETWNYKQTQHTSMHSRLLLWWAPENLFFTFDLIEIGLV